MTSPLDKVLGQLAKVSPYHRKISEQKQRRETATASRDPLEGQEDEGHIPEYTRGTTAEEEAQAGDDPTPDAPQLTSTLRPGSVTDRPAPRPVTTISVSEEPTTPTIHERTVRTVTRDGSEIKIMGWRTTNENEIYQIMKDDVAVSDFFTSLGDATGAYIRGLHTNTFTAFKPKIFEEPVDEKPDITEDAFIQSARMDNLTYRIPGYDEKGRPLDDTRGIPGIVTDTRLMNEYDTGVTSGTGRPKDLPWTYEGAKKRAEQGGALPGETIHEATLRIQGENLKKWSEVGTDPLDMSLDKKHFIGKDDETGEPVYIHESPYQVKHNYTPNDPDFAIIKSDITEQITGTGGIDETISLIHRNVNEANLFLPNLRENLTQIKGAEEGTTWNFSFNQDKMRTQSPEMHDWIHTNIGFNETYSSEDAEKLVEHFIDVNETVAGQTDIISQLQTDKKSLEDTLFTVEKYKELGYEVDIIHTDGKEQYQFRLPKESDVHTAIFGDKEGVALASTAFMESPLAIKTFGSAIWEKVTGDKKIGETRKEELISYSLGLQESIQQRDYGSYIAKVGSSPAMVQGVYIPLTAYAGGYALTGLSAGGAGSTAVGTSTLAKVGATTAGKLTTIGTKTAMLGVGAYGVITTGQHLITTYKERPEAFAGEVSEVAFTFGMAYAGFKGGQKTWTQKHTGSWKYDWKAGKAKWSPKEFKRVDIKGVQDVLEYKMGDKSVFTAEGMQKVGGRDVHIRLHGIGEKIPGKQDISLTRGAGRMTWTEKGKWRTKVTKTKFFEFKGAGKQIEITNLTKDWKAYSSVSKSQMLSGGDPTTGRGTSLVRDWGKVKIVDKGITLDEFTFKPYGGASKTKLSLPKKFTSIYSGTYEGEGSFGRQFQLGRTISFKIGGKPTGDIVGGTGAVTKMDYGLIFKGIGGEAVSIVSKPTTMPALGQYAGVAGVTTTDQKTKTVTKTKTTTDTTAKMDIKTGFSGEKIVLIQAPKISQVEEEIYYTKPDVATGSIIGSSARTGQKLITTQITETAQEVKPDIMERQIDFTGTGLKVGGAGILETESDTKIITDIIPGTFSIGTQRQDQIVEPGSMTKQDIGLAQKQKLGLETIQKQKLKLAQKTDLIDVTVTTPVTVTTTIPAPVMPKPPFLPDDRDTLIRKKAKKKKLTKKPKIMEVGEKDKGLLSDLLSVTVSQARYGTATHPKLTKKIWKAGEKSLYMHVPTKELMKEKKKRKKKKKPKLMRRQKNVFI